MTLHLSRPRDTRSCMVQRNISPRHYDSSHRLTKDEEKAIRQVIADRGIGKTASDLESTKDTIYKLLDGPGLTPAARDRIRANLVKTTTKPVGKARVFLIMAEGDPATVGAILDMVHPDNAAGVR